MFGNRNSEEFIEYEPEFEYEYESAYIHIPRTRMRRVPDPSRRIVQSFHDEALNELLTLNLCI